MVNLEQKQLPWDQSKTLYVWRILGPFQAVFEIMIFGKQQRCMENVSNCSTIAKKMQTKFLSKLHI